MNDVIDAAIVNSIGPVSPAVQPIVTDSEDARWRHWKQQGRADDARFRRNVRAVLAGGAGVVALGGAVWFGFGAWL